MRPLEITAVLGGTGAVAGDFDLPLDSILAAAWMRLHHPDIYYQSTPIGSIKPEDFIEADLPLAKRGAGDAWYWAASFVVWPKATAEHLDTWNKRVDFGELHRIDTSAKTSLTIKSGHYKAYHMPLPVRSALELQWWAYGDPNAVRELLVGVSAVGKKRSQGWGAVREWRVETIADDWSCYRDGKPTRPIPTGGEVPDGADVALRTFRPPYWDNQRVTLCVIPSGEALAV